ncbi:efflux transporter outer membrane subunit [bacterium]|nr:efflux transporter outer membrane subunit [bacterium]
MKNNLVCLFILLVLISGCASVGPNYIQPPLPKPNYSDVLQKDGEKSKITQTALAAWWDTLDDPILTDLIHTAVTNSLDIREAQASVRAARARLGISRAKLFPQLDANANYNKSGASDNTVFSIGETELYQAGFDASWEIDIFGGTRRNVEAARADLQSQEENLKAVWVSLAGEIAQSYISLRTIQTQLRVAESNLATQAETLEILQASYESGLIDELAVQQAHYNLERTRSTIPALRGGMESAMNSLAVLTGAMPGALHERLREARPIPVAPLKRVTGIPANALRQRPDVRKMERQLAAQTARIGVATADLYPKFRLIGSIGLESIDADSLFSSDSNTWSFGPGMTWPIFHAGSIRNNIKAQTAVQEQMLARYEKTLLAAVKEVRDALVDFAEEQNRRQALVAAVQAAQGAEEVARDKYKNGLVDFMNVLDTQRSLLSLQDELARSEGAISINLVRLYKALGGGWTVMK